MRKEDFFEILGELDDDIVKEGKSYMKENRTTRSAWGKWTALAACFCLVTVGVFTVVHPWEMSGTPAPNPNGTIERKPESNEYPPTNTVPGFTLDEPNSDNTFLVVFNDVDTTPAGETAMIALMVDDFYPMSVEESLDYFGVTLPEDGLLPDIELTGGGCFGSGYGVYRSEKRNVYYDINSYEFTGNGKSVTLTLHRLFNTMPSTKQVANGPERIEFTDINGWELALFRYTDENGVQCMYTEFVLDGVTHTISASGLGNNELVTVLMSLLPPKEFVQVPVTIVGTVTHVDSRTSDYFDGAEHHYSEDHDYITVNCDGTRLTIWVPGEADNFNIGDSITVTYNGEPATAYNIWPGQLVSVE